MVVRPLPSGSQASPTRRRVLEYLAMDVLLEQIEIEMFVLATVVIRRQIRFPSHTVIQRQSWCHLPIVLRIERIVKLASVEPVLRALSKGQRTPQQEIAEDQSRRISVERRCTDGIDAGKIVQPLLIDGAAEPELMRSLDPTDVL